MADENNNAGLSRHCCFPIQLRRYVTGLGFTTMAVAGTTGALPV